MTTEHEIRSEVHQITVAHLKEDLKVKNLPRASNKAVWLSKYIESFSPTATSNQSTSSAPTSNSK